MRTRGFTQKTATYLVLLIVILLGACTTAKPVEVPSKGFTEEDVEFGFGDLKLFGILSLPETEDPFPVIVLVSGSGSDTGAPRAGADSGALILHAEQFTKQGFAVLRYDPPGVGRSEGFYSNLSLDERVEEVHSAIAYLLTRPDVIPDKIGLWGASQGCWVIAMTAAQYPKEVAFIISVSGAATSVAEQQVYSVVSQSRSLGMSEENIAKATIFSRLLIDMSLLENSVYEAQNRADAALLGEGPWNDFIRIVYEDNGETPYERLQMIIAILESVQDQNWTTYLYLKNMYITALKSIPADQVEQLTTKSGINLLSEPKEYLTKVTCPVLAIWGEKDPLMDANESARFYTQYLEEAGNTHFTIVVFPNANHSINGFITAYWKTINEWLDKIYP